MGSAISHRRLLQLTALSGAVGLAGFASALTRLTPRRALCSAPGQLPRAWLQGLSSPWMLESAESMANLLNEPRARLDLLVLSIAWRPG